MCASNLWCTVQLGCGCLCSHGPRKSVWRQPCASQTAAHHIDVALAAQHASHNKTHRPAIAPPRLIALPPPRHCEPPSSAAAWRVVRRSSRTPSMGVPSPHCGVLAGGCARWWSSLRCASPTMQLQRRCMRGVVRSAGTRHVVHHQPAATHRCIDGACLWVLSAHGDAIERGEGRCRAL